MGGRFLKEDGSGRFLTEGGLAWIVTEDFIADVVVPTQSEGARGGGFRSYRGSAKVNSRRIDDLVAAAVAKLEAERNPQAPPPSPKAVLRTIKAQEIPDLSISLEQVRAAIARLRAELAQMEADNDHEEAAMMLLLST